MSGDSRGRHGDQLCVWTRALFGLVVPVIPRYFGGRTVLPRTVSPSQSGSQSPPCLRTPLNSHTQFPRKRMNNRIPRSLF